MTLQYKGGARVPGPLGISPGGIGGRIPGPIGRTLWQKPSTPPAPGAVAKAVKKTKMPRPAKDGQTKNAHEVTWKLFGMGAPRTGDVKQGALANCPIAAILAALAHTASGRKRIQDMVVEHNTRVETDLTGVAGELDSLPKNNTIISNRYFTVTLGETIEVSDVFYTNDADRNWSLIYMQSPTNALWPCVIEKAYAVKLNGYEEVDDDVKHTANEFWKGLVGSNPKGFAVNDKTDIEKIREAAKAASRVPTIGASKDNATKVTAYHGYAVLGIQDSTIELYNPYGRIEKISLKDFRSNFKAIYWGNP
jgi:calpain family cysteine protease